MKTLHMMVGLPRSGKSTAARGMGFPIVSPDEIRLALHARPFVPEAEPMVAVLARLMVIALFGAGHEEVILDGCHVTRERRDPWKDDRWNRVYVRPADAFDMPLCVQRALDSKQGYLVDVIASFYEKREAIEEDEVDAK